MRRGLSLGLALLAGCGGATSLRLDVSEAPGRPAPSELRLALFAHGPIGGPWYLPFAAAQKSLPGSLVVGPLDPALPDFRVQLDGVDAARAVTSQAAARVTLVPGHEVRSALVLDAPLDTDGDGVADAIDDCPQVPDPLQDCAAPDLGTPDLPLVDLSAPIDLAPPACPPGALFCDDLETGDASKWPLASQGNYNTRIVVDTAMPWRGSYSAHATGDVNLLDGGYHSDYAVLDHRFGAISGKQVWARAYVYISRPAEYVMVMSLEISTDGHAVGIDSNGNWVVTQDGATRPDLTTALSAATGRWVCLELGVIDTNTAKVQLYVDSQPVPFTDPGSVGITTFPTHFTVGLVRTPGDVPIQVFVDDVAVSTSRVGCE